MSIDIDRNKFDDMEWEHLSDKIRRKMVYGEKAMLTLIELDDGTVVPQHSHENEQITYVLSGRMRFWFGADRETEIEVGPGETLVIPSSVPHEALMIGDVVEMDIFAPPRQDWIDGTDDYLREEH